MQYATLRVLYIIMSLLLLSTPRTSPPSPFLPPPYPLSYTLPKPSFTPFRPVSPPTGGQFRASRVYSLGGFTVRLSRLKKHILCERTSLQGCWYVLTMHILCCCFFNFLSVKLFLI